MLEIKPIAQGCFVFMRGWSQPGTHGLDLVVAGDVGHGLDADERLHEAAPEIPARLVAGGGSAERAGRGPGRVRGAQVRQSGHRRGVIICEVTA